MPQPRISASSYSNTAPLIWSFLYGQNRGKYELILDNAPARSAELLAQKRVDAALVPVIEYQRIDNILLVPDVCVGARERVKSDWIAEMTYTREGARKLVVDHTEVDESLRGKGIGEQLVEEAVKYARENNLLIKPVCPFVKTILEKDEKYEDVLTR